MTSEHRALRLAHRGDWRSGPENGLDAMRAALALPTCDGLEFDVRGSLDGVPVLLHDESLGRVQGADRLVESLTAGELAAYAIPTLAEVLALAGEKPFLDVELKGRPLPSVVPVLDAARGSGGGGGAATEGTLARAVVSSFEPETLAWISGLRPGWGLWLNTEDELSDATIDLARSVGCTGISAGWRSIDETAVERMRAAGLEVAAWTVRDRDLARRLDALGVSAICAEADALET